MRQARRQELRLPLERCLFSDMRPTKILAAIVAARLAGVTHIIEEGRFGGLSSYMLNLHGFQVTSIEYLPLDGTTNSLRALAPQIRLLTGDGSELLERLLRNISPEQARRTMVIFDGEKRFAAWKTYQKIRDKVAIAILDDTNIRDGDKLKAMWRETGVIFTECARAPCARRAQRTPRIRAHARSRARSARARRAALSSPRPTLAARPSRRTRV
jgi:hypothetical protein